MFKRISAFAVAVSLLASVPVSSGVYASDESAIVHINEVFDDYPTNGEPDCVVAESGIDARVCETDGNKYYYARAWDEDVELKIPVNSTAKDFIISGRVKLSGKKTSGELFKIVDSSNRSCPLIIMSDNGSLSMADGKRISADLYGGWNEIGCRVNMNTKKISLYINGRAVAENWTLKSMSITYLSAVKFMLTSRSDGEETNISIDNFRIYESEEFLTDKDFSAKKHNTEVLEYAETLTKPELGSYVFFDVDFKGGVSQLTPINKTKLTSKKDENDNGYAHISRIGEVFNAYADIYLSEQQQKIIAKSKGLVIEADVMPVQTGASISVLSQRNTDGSWVGGFSIKPGGEWSYNGGSVQLPLKKWSRLGMIYNYIDSTISYYLDGKLLSMVDNPNKRTKRGSLRIDIPGNGGDIEYGIDNIKMYEGIELKPRAEKEQGADENLSPSASAVANFISAMETEDDAKALIGNSVVLMINSGMIYANGEKTECTAKPYISAEGRTMIPVRLVSEALGCSVEWNDAQRTVTVNGNAKMTIGKNTINVNGSDIELDSPPVIKDDSTFLPLRALCENVLGKKVAWDERGMAIISDEEYPHTDSEKISVVTDKIDTVFRYMQYDRPSGEEVESLIKQNFPDNSHPRLVIDKEGIAELKQKVANDEYSAEWARRIIDQAEVDYNQPVATYYKRDGLRLLPVSWVTQEKIERWTLSYWLTGDRRYADRAWKEIEATSKFPDWNDKKHFLDTAEMANAYALAYDAFYDVYTDEQKKIMRDTLFEKAFLPGLEAYSGSHPNGYWITGDDNWTAVCPAGLLVAALVIIDDGDYAEICRTIIEQTCQSLEYVMGLFYPDGAWYESFGYLIYTMHHVAMGVGGLMNCTGNDYNFLSVQGFDNVGNFFLHMHGPGMGGFNYHDGGTGFQIEETFLWYAVALDMPEFMDARMSLARFLDDATNPLYPYALVWYNPEWDTGRVTPLLDAYYIGAETGTMRNNWREKDSPFVGVHGGRNHIDHDNLDLGSFIYEADGIRWAEDMGTDSYDLPGYFSLQGYNYYLKRPEGNNCMIINPRDGHYGQYLDAYAPMVQSSSGENSAYMVFDMTNTYQDDAHSATRGFYFGDNRSTLTVRDEVELKGDSEILWFMHTRADIEIDGNTAYLTSGDKKLKVEVLSNASECEVLEMEAKPLPTSPVYDGQMKAERFKEYKKLTVKLKANGKVNLSVKLIPVNDTVVSSPLTDIPISEWKTN